MEDEVTVREIMTRDYLGVSEADPVDEAAALMREEGASVVVVLRGTEPVGMLTATDALGLVTGEDDASATEVGDVMSGTVPSVEPEAPVVQAAGTMADAGIGSLLVTEGDAVTGVVSERDVVQAMATLADHATLDEPTGAAEQGRPGAAAAPAAAAEAGAGEGVEHAEGEHATQSVCETCGALTPDLQSFNGQLICGDCRDM